MAEVRVSEDVLEDVARASDGHADDVRDARRRHAGATSGALGQVAVAHADAVQRWQVGLATVGAAVDELAAELRACATAYRGTDDDASVAFRGIVPTGA